MRLLRIIQAYFLLLLCSNAYSQVTSSTFPFLQSAQPYMQVKVYDKETGTPMEGASVFLSYQRDTIKKVAGRNGVAAFARHHFGKADTLTVDISYLGYKKIRHREPMLPVLVLDVRMEEDPEQLNAIVIRDDRILMLRHGDTTVYNASAVATMEGAKLGDLLKKLPGVTVSKDGVSAQGEKVSKILINGTMLFENNIAAALDMVSTEAVERVRVYNEYTLDRLVKKDTLDRKEKVMDVETKKPFTRAQELALLALGGVYVDNNGEVGGAIAGVEENWRSFKNGKPSYQINAGLGHNYNTSGENSVASSPANTVYANIRTSHNKPFKSRMSHNFEIKGRHRRHHSTTEDIYSPTSYFTERRDSRSTESDNANLDLRYFGSRGFTIRENSSIDFDLNLSYNRSRRLSMEDLKSVTDGRDFIVNSRDSSLSNRYGAGFGLKFSHHFKKAGRKLNAGVKYGGNYGRGNEELTDTMATSTSPQWLTIGDDNDFNSFGFNLSYDEPLIGNTFRLNAAYKLSGDFSKTEKIAFDELLKRQDRINTQSFTHRDIGNELSVGLRWRTKDNALSLSADAVYIRSDQLRNESVPNTYRQPRAYHQLSPKLDFHYSRNGVNLSLDYVERPRIPSIEQTSPILDNSSHLYLTAGNPSLKASRDRSVSLNFSSMLGRTGGTLGLRLNYMNTADMIVNRTTYFESVTLLPEYGFTAAAGSRLVRPVNVNGGSSLSSGLEWNYYSPAMKSTLTLVANYRFGRSPFMTGEQLSDSRDHNLGLSLNFISGFSKYFEMILMANAGVGRELMDGTLFYDSFSFSANLNMKGNFLKRFYVGTDISGNIYRTTIQALDYDALSWDMSLSYKLGKKQQTEFTIACNDILNKSLNTLMFVRDSYVRTMKNTVFGRSITLTFRYTFR